MPNPPKAAVLPTVSEHLDRLSEPLRTLAKALRRIILEASPEVGEQVKWNSPSFYYTGEMHAFVPREYKRDVVVLNLHREQPLLVFPSGAKVEPAPALQATAHPDGRLLVRISDLADAQAKADALQQVIRQWLALVEK